MLFWFPSLNHLSCPEHVLCRGAWGSFDQLLQGRNLFSTCSITILQCSLQIIKIPMHLWYIYQSMIHLKNLWYIYDRKVTLWLHLFCDCQSQCLDSASGASSPASLPRRVRRNSPAPWRVLGTPWAGWPCDLLHWRCSQYIAAITRLRAQRVDVDSVGMCISCSLGFWHEDSLKFWIVYQCVYYVWMLALYSLGSDLALIEV